MSKNLCIVPRKFADIFVTDRSIYFELSFLIQSRVGIVNKFWWFIHRSDSKLFWRCKICGVWGLSGERWLIILVDAKIVTFKESRRNFKICSWQLYWSYSKLIIWLFLINFFKFKITKYFHTFLSERAHVIDKMK